jgi:hypothetical protein
MKTRSIQALGIALIVLIGIIHLYLTPEQYLEAPYMGYLFAANFCLAVIASVGIRQWGRSTPAARPAWGWTLGLIVAAGSIYVYLLTRTVGLPGIQVQEWLYPLGLLSLAAEAGFVVLAVSLRPWGKLSGSQRYILPGAYLAAVLVFGMFAFLGSRSAHNNQAHLASAQPISDEALLDQYGVQVKLVGLSMMGSIVDFRLRIVDAEKAHKLLDNPDTMPMLVVEDSLLQLHAPHGHHQDRLKDGGAWYMFFPNPGSSVRIGTPVIVMFGNLRLEGTVAAQ